MRGLTGLMFIVLVTGCTTPQLTFTSKPSGATVYLDNEYCGITPCQIGMVDEDYQLGKQLLMVAKLTDGRTVSQNLSLNQLPPNKLGADYGSYFSAPFVWLGGLFLQSDREEDYSKSRPYGMSTKEARAWDRKARRRKDKEDRVDLQNSVAGLGFYGTGALVHWAVDTVVGDDGMVKTVDIKFTRKKQEAKSSK